MRLALLRWQILTPGLSGIGRRHSFSWRERLLSSLRLFHVGRCITPKCLQIGPLIAGALPWFRSA